MPSSKKELKDLLDNEFGRKKDVVLMLIMIVIISIILILIFSKYL